MSAYNYNKYWSDKKNSGARYQSEEFYYRYAQEELFHLDGGKSLLNFGCGAGEILTYLAEKYNDIIAVDFSESMLEAARKRSDEKACKDKIRFIQASDKTIWEKVTNNIDRLLASGVTQYLTIEQIDNFLDNAKDIITKEGKIILFDIIDPRIHYLVSLGLFKNKKINNIKIIQKMMKLKINGLYRKFKKLPPLSLGMGYAYLPNEIEKIAFKYNLKFEYCWSMYYEYRFHVILTKES
jgi:cyclopropane-fatty-acyl-phospholipid synthase